MHCKKVLRVSDGCVSKFLITSLFKVSGPVRNGLRSSLTMMHNSNYRSCTGCIGPVVSVIVYQTMCTEIFVPFMLSFTKMFFGNLTTLWYKNDQS